MITARGAPPRFAATAAHRPDGVIGWLAAGSIAFLVLFNIALISLSVASIPVRSVLSVALLGMFVILRPHIFQQAIARHGLVFLLAGVLAAAGVYSSFVSGGSPAVIFRTLLEVHVQAVVTLLFATVAAQLAGPRAAVFAFVGAVGVSATVAIAQMGGLDFAWDLREMLGGLQGHKLHENSSFINRRPMGLSYSPIHLGTQATLAFAAYAGLRYWESGGRLLRGMPPIDWRVLVGLAAMIVVCIACATRSPILGAGVFVIAYFAIQGDARTAILLLAVGAALYLAAPVILDAMQDSEMRAFRVGDNSSTGRVPLFTFGFLLFLDNPLGYGFDFTAHEYWTKYWADLYTLPSAAVIRDSELHNYFLNMLTTYGIGLLLALPLAACLIWRGRTFLPVFIPYIVHITFHNSGPFWNDNLFWFVIGAFCAMQPFAAKAAEAPSQPAARTTRQQPGFRPRFET